MPPWSPRPVIVNVAGGAAGRAGADLGDQLNSAFAAAGSPIALELVKGDGIAAALARHSTAPRIAVGGGDGTLAAAASAVARGGAELAILPLGTRNHLARQLNIPLEIEAAAKLAVDGRSERIDLGAAEERVFVNNLSVGAYVDLVRAREASPLPKLLATVPATWRTLRKLRSRRFQLTLDGASRSILTPLLFVGNNRYEIEEGRPGERPTLDDGLLSIYAIAPLPRSALLAAALRTLIGRPRMHRDFVLDETVKELRIEGPRAKIELALDGERCRFDLPLTIRIRPQALAVVTPENS
jgi:diacylglycerol kinase family enzyme